MKLKKLLIPSILLFLVGGGIKICDTLFNVNGSGFLLSSAACNLTLAGVFVLIYLLGCGLSFADRKKNFRAEPSKNFLCGLFGFIAAVTIITTGAVRLLTLGQSLMVESILAILAGLVLLYEACISFTGVNGMKKMPVLALVVPVWCCIRFIDLFIDYTQKSLKATELFDIIALAFLIMFLFYQSMYFAGINNRTAVRKSAVYGAVFIVLGLIVCADLFLKMAIGKAPLPNIDTQVVEPTFLNIVIIAGDIALCCYAFFFLFETIRTADKNLTWPSDHPQDDLLLTEDTEENEPAETPDPENAPSAGSDTAELPAEDNLTDITSATATVEYAPYQTASQDTEPVVPQVRKMTELQKEATPPQKETPPKDDTNAYGELFRILDEISE